MDSVTLNQRIEIKGLKRGKWMQYHGRFGRVISSPIGKQKKSTVIIVMVDGPDPSKGWTIQVTLGDLVDATGSPHTPYIPIGKVVRATEEEEPEIEEEAPPIITAVKPQPVHTQPDPPKPPKAPKGKPQPKRKGGKVVKALATLDTVSLRLELEDRLTSEVTQLPLLMNSYDCEKHYTRDQIFDMLSKTVHPV